MNQHIYIFVERMTEDYWVFCDALHWRGCSSD